MNVSKLLSEASSLHQAGRLVEAKTLYKKIIAKYPKNLEARNLLGGVCFACGDYEEAIRQIDVALRVNPKAAFAHNNRGKILVNMQNFDEALASFDRAISLQPNYAEAWKCTTRREKVQRRLNQF